MPKKHMGIPLIPVTHQMEEILNRQRLATESAIRKDSDESGQPHSTSAAKSPKFPPPAVKKKPVRAPVKSSDFLDNENKSHELSGVVSRSCENLVSAANDEETSIEQNTDGDNKLSKRISASYSVEDIKGLKEITKPPAVKARKMLPGAVRLITPKPKEGQVELAKPSEDESDSLNPTPNQDKEDTSLDRSRPQTPEPNSPDNKDDNSPNDEQVEAEKINEATGGSGNADILFLPDWTTEEVCIWLQRCGLGELATSLKLGDVTGKLLLDLDGGKMKVGII